MTEWAGADEIQRALKDACRQFPPSGSRMAEVANACLKHIKEYKLVVHELERFVRKAGVGHVKVLGLYAIDATLSKVRAKAATGGDDKVGKRMADKLASVVSHISARDMNEETHRGVSRLLAGWQRKNVFPPKVCECFQFLIQDGYEYVLSPAPSASPLHGAGGGVAVVVPMGVPLSRNKASGPTGGTFAGGSSASSGTRPGAGTRAGKTDPRKGAKVDPRKRGSTLGRSADPRKRSRGATSAAASGSGSSTGSGGAKEKEVSYSDRASTFAHERLSNGLRSVKVRPFNVGSMAPLTTSASVPTRDPAPQPAEVVLHHFTLYPAVQGAMEVRTISRAELATLQ